MSFLHNSYQILFRPQKAFEGLKDNYSLNVFLQGILVFCGAQLIANNFSFNVLADRFASLFFLSFYVFITAYIFVLKGRDFFKLLAFFAFSFLPLIFAKVFDILCFEIEPLSILVNLILTLWVFNLQILIIEKVCLVNRAKAILLYLLVPMSIGFFIAVTIAQALFILMF